MQPDFKKKEEEEEDEDAAHAGRACEPEWSRKCMNRFWRKA